MGNNHQGILEPAVVNQNFLRQGILCFVRQDDKKPSILNKEAVEQVKRTLKEYDEREGVPYTKDTLGLPQYIEHINLNHISFTPHGASELADWLNSGSAAGKPSPLTLNLGSDCSELTADVIRELSKAWTGEGARVTALRITTDLDEEAYKALHESFKKPGSSIECYEVGHIQEHSSDYKKEGSRINRAKDLCQTIASPDCHLKALSIDFHDQKSPAFHGDTGEIGKALTEALGSKDCKLERLDYASSDCVRADAVANFAKTIAANQHLTHFTLRAPYDPVRECEVVDANGNWEATGEIAKMLLENPRIVQFSVPDDLLSHGTTHLIEKALLLSDHPNLLSFNQPDRDFKHPDQKPYGSPVSAAIHNHCVANARQAGDLVKAIRDDRVSEEQKAEIALRAGAIDRLCHEGEAMNGLAPTITLIPRTPHNRGVEATDERGMADLRRKVDTFMRSNNAAPASRSEERPPAGSPARSYQDRLRSEAGEWFSPKQYRRGRQGRA